MTALAAFNPDSAATMQFINTALLDELAQGTPLGEAMVNVSLLLYPPTDGNMDTPATAVLTQLGPMLMLAPAVISGAMTVLAAIPEAVIPVMGAVVVAVVKSAAAVGSDGFAATVQAGLYDVMTAAAKGIATMVNVVKAVLQDISAVLTGGSTATNPAPAAAAGLRVAGRVEESGKTAAPSTTKRAPAAAKPARGVGGPRPRHSTSAPAAATSSRSADSDRAAGKRDSRPAATKGTGKSAR
ncbi:hypothetical protein MSZK_21330 [Mycobacterium sp. shizuoka-1]|nr:hypothetical protein MSZK_21330 [Mycobacterium sp. shizuoka-1]